MMMLPATTTSLPNFFTPSRLLTLSRPFLTLPCPFLCAMRLSGFVGIAGLGLLRFGSLSAKADAGDFDAGQLAAMADGSVVALSPAIFESDDFLVLALLDDFARHGRPFNERAAVGELIAVAMERAIGTD